MSELGEVSELFECVQTAGESDLNQISEIFRAVHIVHTALHY